MKISDYKVDPVNGVVYGRLGRPIGVKDRDGYLRMLSNGRHVSYCHRFIWETVHGEIPDGLYINHINGVKGDNRIANLELVTPLGNTRHAMRTGLFLCDGESNPRAKLTAVEVVLIRDRAGRGEARSSLAREYGVALSTIQSVVSRQNWKFVA